MRGEGATAPQASVSSYALVKNSNLSKQGTSMLKFNLQSPKWENKQVNTRLAEQSPDNALEQTLILTIRGDGGTSK